MAYTVDLFSDGLKNLREIIEYEQQRVLDAGVKMMDDVERDAIPTIQKNANSMVTHDYEAYKAVHNFNEVLRTSLLEVMVLNNHQQATYSEYGTGIIGSHAPHVDPKMTWEYDVNEHGFRGWRYKTEGGQWVHTRGLPSTPVFYISSLEIMGDCVLSFKKAYKGIGDKR